MENSNFFRLWKARHSPWPRTLIKTNPAKKNKIKVAIALEGVLMWERELPREPRPEKLERVSGRFLIPRRGAPLAPRKPAPPRNKTKWPWMVIIIANVTHRCMGVYYAYRTNLQNETLHYFSRKFDGFSIGTKISNLPLDETFILKKKTYSQWELRSGYSPFLLNY